MRRLGLALAVIGFVAWLAAGAGGVARAQSAGVSGPTITPATTQLEPGDRVVLTLTGWTSRNLTLSVCGNLAKRGAGDCNLVSSRALKLMNSPEPTLTELLVTPPPGTCPCVIRGSSSTQDEVAVVPIELVGWPVGPVIGPVFDALIDVSVDVRTAQRGFLAAARATLAGRSDYLVTATVHNLTTESLSGISLAGSAGRSRNDQDVSFTMPPPDALGPGQTWQQAVRVTLPAPVLRVFTWRITASGAGEPVTAEVESRSLPIGFVLAASVFAAAVAAMFCRRVRRRRRQRSERADRRREEAAARLTSVRRPALTLVVIGAVLVGLRPVPPAVASATAVAVLVIDGKGDGHGVGMSQDGALAMGRAGATTDDILAKFYPGTEVDEAGGVIGVRILESDATTVEVAFPDGGEVRASPDGPHPEGFPLTVGPGGTVTVALQGGSFHASSGDREETESAMGGLRLIADESDESGDSTTTTSEDASSTTTTVVEEELVPSTTTSSTTATTEVPPTTPPTTLPSSVTADGGLWLVPPEGSTIAVAATGRRYRGQVEVGDSALGGLLLVDHVDVEDYLRGMGEVLDASWPPAALRTQAIAARTYALRATRTGGTMCDDDRCQVYLGASVEYPAMDEAVEASAGQVLTFGGGLASTVYSASAGGVTATPREGFGTEGADYPYLPSAPYAASDPPTWSTSIALADLGRRLGYPGHVLGAAVAATGPSGRVLQVLLEGDRGSRTVDGLHLAAELGLDSTLFTIRAAAGAPSPPLPSRKASIQAHPDAVASLPPLRAVVVSTDEPTRSPAEHVVGSILILAAAACLALQSRRRRGHGRAPR